MPSRRALLAAAAAVPAALAGCSALDSGPPDYAGWFHAPGAVVPGDRHAFASLDLAGLRGGDTPSPLAGALRRLDGELSVVDLADGERLLAQVGGDLSRGRVAASAVAVGSFSPARVRERLDVGAGGFREAGTAGEFDLYAYAPEFLAALDRYRPPDGAAPDLSLAVGARDGTVVAGAALAPDQRGLDSLRATLDARDGDDRLVERRPARDLLAVVGRDAFAVGVSGAVVDTLAARADGTLAEVLAGTEALAVGLRPDDGEARWALAGATGALDPATVRRAAAEAGGGGIDVRGVGLRRDGRVAVARTGVDWDAFAARLDDVGAFLRGPVLNGEG